MSPAQIMKECVIESLDLAKEFVNAGELSFAIDQCTKARDGILTLAKFSEVPAVIPGGATTSGAASRSPEGAPGGSRPTTIDI